MGDTLLGFRSQRTVFTAGKKWLSEDGLFAPGLHGRAWLSSVPLPEAWMWLLVGVRLWGAHKQDTRCLHETLWGEQLPLRHCADRPPPGRSGGPGTPDTSLGLQASLSGCPWRTLTPLPLWLSPREGGPCAQSLGRQGLVRLALCSLFLCLVCIYGKGYCLW